MMLAFALAAIAAPPQAAQRPSSDVVVVGRWPEGDALAACRARHCPPDEEAAAALAAANTQYVAGDYVAARRTLAASLARTRGSARTHPDAVAGLLTGLGRIDAHLGDFAAHGTASRRAYLIVRDAHGPGDPRTIARKLAMAEAFLAGGQEKLGFDSYAEAVEDTERAGDPEQQALVRLRFAAALQRVGNQRARAERVLAPVLAGNEPALAGHRFAAHALIAKLRPGREGDVALVAVAGTLPADVAMPPVLLSAQRVEQPAWQQNGLSCEPNPDLGNTDRQASANVLLGCGDVREQIPTQSFSRQWVDVDFVIGADGRVRDVAITRRSGETEGPWADEVLKTLRKRRYAALTGRPDAARRERYTLTARFHTLTGSRIPVREARPVVEMVDITPGRAAYLSTVN